MPVLRSAPSFFKREGERPRLTLCGVGRVPGRLTPGWGRQAPAVIGVSSGRATRRCSRAGLNSLGQQRDVGCTCERLQGGCAGLVVKELSAVEPV